MEDVLAVRDEYRLQSWAEIIQECQASGLTNREFCTQRGISEKTYYGSNYSVFPVIPSQCRNTGVGIRFSFAQVSQFEYAKEMRIATPVTSVAGSQ